MIIRKAESSKMHTSLVAIILVSIVIPATDTSPAAFKNYQVREVVRVLSPHSFQCKLHNYKPAPSVSFRVNLSGLDTQDTDGLSKELLTDRLKSAKQIELRNIKFRNYFRVDADLWLDGQPFWEQPASPDIQNKKEIDHQPITASPWHRPHQSKLSSKQAMPVRRGGITIRNLLDTQVDCSMLSDDTPLFEALTILSESVEPHLPLLILWKDLETHALIEKETPISVEGFGRMKLRLALDIVLRSVSVNGSKLALVAEGRIITLASAQTLLKDKITGVYSAEDLLAQPSTGNMYNQGGFGNRGGSGNNTGGYTSQ